MERTRVKPEVSPLVQGLGGMLLLAATLVGVIGTIYKFLQPDGWLTSLTEEGVPGGPAAVLIVVTLGVLATVGPSRQRRWSGNLMMYLFAAAGVYFLAHIVARGAF